MSARRRSQLRNQSKGHLKRTTLDYFSINDGGDRWAEIYRASVYAFTSVRATRFANRTSRFLTKSIRAIKVRTATVWKVVGSFEWMLGRRKLFEKYGSTTRCFRGRNVWMLSSCSAVISVHALVWLRNLEAGTHMLTRARNENINKPI